MDRQSRTDVRCDYKEQVQPKGIYCIRCAATTQIWVDSSRDLAASESRLNFSLKAGLTANATLGKELDRFGAGSFTFEVLQVFDLDLSAYELAESLKERRKYWQQILSAQSLYR